MPDQEWFPIPSPSFASVGAMFEWLKANPKVAYGGHAQGNPDKWNIFDGAFEDPNKIYADLIMRSDSAASSEE